MKPTNINTPRSMDECCFIGSGPIEYGEDKMHTSDLIVLIGSLLSMIAVIVMAIIGIITN